MFCKNCGKEIPTDATFCPECGTSVNGVAPVNPNYATYPINKDTSNAGFNLLAFLVPLFGIIFYFVDRDDHPVRAKGTLKWAIISIAVQVGLSVLSFLAFFLLASLSVVCSPESFTEVSNAATTSVFECFPCT